jgi:hypothetical protein
VIAGVDAPATVAAVFDKRNWLRARNIGHHRSATELYPSSTLRALRRMLVMPPQELMEGEGDFVGMRCAPGNNALELYGIVGDGAHFHQLGFDDLGVSHRSSSMAHFGKLESRDGRSFDRRCRLIMLDDWD